MKSLSSKSVAQLVAATAPSYTMGVKARREQARKAVLDAAKELGIDASSPPLPKFSSGESVVVAAARLLQLPGIEEELAQDRARVEAGRAEA
ncbi:MAG: hypothetical protein ACRDNP_12325, partial [Gaiellaceae bacterium]